MKSINIGIITYNRQNELIRLLESLNNLVTDNSFTIENVVVVDNSPDFNTQEIKSEINKSKYSVIHEHEKQPGIPFARNKVVELSKDVDFLAFIDDDEIADENWILELVKCQQKYHADVVRGPVLPKYDKAPPKWLQITAQRPRFKTGKSMISLATNNVLLNMGLFKNNLNPFDIRLAQTGGTDSLLGRELVKKGHSIIWCDEAIVYEFIVTKRQSLSWMIQRSYRGGNNFSLQLRILNSGRLAILRRVIVSFLHIIEGVLYLPLILFPIKKKFISPLKFAEGVGGIVGVLGLKYNEYKRSN